MRLGLGETKETIDRHRETEKGGTATEGHRDRETEEQRDGRTETERLIKVILRDGRTETERLIKVIF